MKFEQEDRELIKRFALDPAVMKWLDLRYNLAVRDVVNASSPDEAEAVRVLRTWASFRDLFANELRRDGKTT